MGHALSQDHHGHSPECSSRSTEKGEGQTLPGPEKAKGGGTGWRSMEEMRSMEDMKKDSGLKKCMCRGLDA